MTFSQEMRRDRIRYGLSMLAVAIVMFALMVVGFRRDIWAFSAGGLYVIFAEWAKKQVAKR